jgi:hypothetical protein
MDIITIAKVIEAAFSIFCMHCIMMSVSTYYRSLYQRLLGKQERYTLSGKLAADVNDALAQGGL